MSDGPVVNVGAQALEPLVEVALQAKQPKVRIAVLGALSRFPLSHGAWRVYGGVIRTTLEREAPGTALRRKAIEIGAGVPLLSVRNAVRSIAATRTADAKFARKALDDAGDVTGIKPLLAQIRSGKATPDAYKMLARMPLEDAGLAPQDLPKLSGRWHTELWRALALARLGDYSAIDAFLDAASGEEKVSKRRLAARHAAASIHPLPPAMQRHLLERMPELILDIGANMVHFVGQGYIDPVQMQRAAWPILPPGLRIDSMGIAQRVLDEQLRVAELQGIKRLPGPYLSSIVGNLVHEGNRRAQQMRGRKLRVEILGDRIVETLPGPGFVVGDLPVGELLMEQVHTRYTALNDNQLAYVIAHDRADHLMRLTPGVIESAGNAAVRVVEIVGRAGDFQSGRGAAPMRGTSVAFEQEMHVHVPLMDDVTPIISVGRDDYEISQQMRHVCGGGAAAARNPALLARTMCCVAESTKNWSAPVRMRSESGGKLTMRASEQSGQTTLPKALRQVTSPSRRVQMRHSNQPPSHRQRSQKSKARAQPATPDHRHEPWPRPHAPSLHPHPQALSRRSRRNQPQGTRHPSRNAESTHRFSTKTPSAILLSPVANTSSR